ncbi:MAG: hypothetical protein ACRDH0_08820 [Actinomycetota bacterium]
MASGQTFLLMGSREFEPWSEEVTIASQLPALRRRRFAVEWLSGLDLIPGMGFGVHWDKVRFIPMLRPCIMSRGGSRRVVRGIDERTAILGDGRQWTVLGTRTAMVRHARTTRSNRAGGPFRPRADRSAGPAAGYPEEP